MNWIRHYYQKYRSQGYSARESIRAARIRDEWDEWENEGLVKLELVPDDSPDLSYLDDDCFQDRQGKSLAKKERELAERDGVWGQVGYWRLDPDDDWQVGDSVWGFVGNDYANDNPYSVDIMAGTMEELLSAMTPRVSL